MNRLLIICIASTNLLTINMILICVLSLILVSIFKLDKMSTNIIEFISSMLLLFFVLRVVPRFNLL